jgi:serine/threonine-protein kinase
VAPDDSVRAVITGLAEEEAQPAGDEAPTRVGAYRLDAVIGRGGFGVVYSAVHLVRGTPAAFKIMHAELASSAHVVPRFEREVEAVQRIRHPGVIEIFEHGRLADGRPYFAMELLSGVSLDAHLAARGRLSADEVLAIFEPLCAAVAAAHERAIVHRDIKASNVFLAEEGGRRRVVLLDFGVAKLLDAEGPGLTASRQVVGTLAWMAPEQILGTAVGPQTDVYALGVLAYRALTGEMPFSGRSPLAAQQMHLYAEVRPPSACAPVSPAFDDVLARALAKSPAGRQPSAAAFFDELRAAGRRPASAEPRPALVVFVELRVDPQALEAPGEHLLSDLERVLPAAAAALAPLGLAVAMETGTSLLLARARPATPAGDARLRGDTLALVAALHAQLEGRPGRDVDVDVRVHVHLGALTFEPGGLATGGALLDLASWVPEVGSTRPLVSRAAREGLDVPVRALDPEGEGWAELAPGWAPAAPTAAGDESAYAGDADTLPAG